jgi:hypothetical protein
VCRSERSSEECDAPSVLRDPFQSGRNSGRRGGPHQEYGIDAIQAFINSLGESEISAYHINVWRQTSRVRVAGERADSHARGPPAYFPVALRRATIASIAGRAMED